MCSYRRKGAQNLDPILGSEGMRGVQGGEVGQSSGGVCWCPAQYVTQLWRVGIDCVPRHQKLERMGKKGNMSVYSNTLFTIHLFVLCVHHTIHMGTSNSTVPWCKFTTSIEGELTKLQRKRCLLVAKVTGINDCEVTGRIMFWSVLAFGESHDPAPVVLY